MNQWTLLILKLELVKYKLFRRCVGVISEMQSLFRSLFCIGNVLTMRRRRELAG